MQQIQIYFIAITTKIHFQPQQRLGEMPETVIQSMFVVTLTGVTTDGP